MTTSPDNSTLYVAGDFSRVNGKKRSQLAAFATDSGSLSPSWRPSVDGFPLVLRSHGKDVFIGGQFQHLAGAARRDIGAVSASSGAPTPLKLDPSGSTGFLDDRVEALLFKGSHVYVAGSFTKIGGVTRPSLAEVDLGDGHVTGWKPKPDRAVHALGRAGDTIYAGGEFTELGGKKRAFLGAIKLADGSATGWNPHGVDGANKGDVRGILGLHVTSKLVYVTGTFKAIGSAPRNRIAAVRRSDGKATSFHPATQDLEALFLREPDGTLIAGTAFPR